jgi:hypothetical protein
MQKSVVRRQWLSTEGRLSSCWTFRRVHVWEACSGVVPGSNASSTTDKNMSAGKWLPLAAIAGEDDFFSDTA